MEASDTSQNAVRSFTTTSPAPADLNVSAASPRVSFYFFFPSYGWGSGDSGGSGNSSNNGGLIAGIVVACVGGVILIVSIVVIIVQCHRQRARAAQQAAQVEVVHPPPNPPLPALDPAMGNGGAPAVYNNDNFNSNNNNINYNNNNDYTNYYYNNYANTAGAGVPPPTGPQNEMVVMGAVGPAVPPALPEGAVTPLGMPATNPLAPSVDNYVYGTPVGVPPAQYANAYGSSVYYARQEDSATVRAFSRVDSTLSEKSSDKSDGCAKK